MTTQTAAQNRKKPRGRPFPPGNRANPGGRPKLPEDVKHVREMARLYTEDAIGALVSVMSSGSGPARVAAANSMLERGWGKPEQPVIGAGENGEHIHRVEFAIVDPQG